MQYVQSTAPRPSFLQAIGDFPLWPATKLFLAAALLALGACGGGGGGGGSATGVTSSGCVGGCAGGGGTTQQSQLLPELTARPPLAGQGTGEVFPYQPGARYADQLEPCTYAGDNTASCTLDQLPFLGQEFADPSIDDVLSRALVSDQWMGDNLRLLLTELPSDLLRMFRSVTAIVIASDIRPAFYAPAIGAIYLDPDFLWLTQQQAGTVSDAPDFRSGFGDDLQVRFPWRYVRDSERLTVQQDAAGNRLASSLAPVLALLLYHELGHAMDFMPARKLATLSAGRSLSVEQAVLSGPIESDGWIATYPLDSQPLAELAQIVFGGAELTTEAARLRANDLVDDFANNGAVQHYGHFNQFEDFATVFETVMMAYHFGFQKDIAVTDSPLNGVFDDAIVFWGQRGRLGDQTVFQRARDSILRLYPGDNLDILNFLASQPVPTPLITGRTWSRNLTLLNGAGNGAPSLDAVSGAPLTDDLLSRRPFH